MQRNFELMRKQVETWQASELTDVNAKVVIYKAFVERKLEAPKHLARTVHDLYFEPSYEEFKPRTIRSLSNAFTSAFKALDPIPQFRATAKLGEFLEARFSSWFYAFVAVAAGPLHLSSFQRNLTPNSETMPPGRILRAARTSRYLRKRLIPGCNFIASLVLK